MGFTDTYSTIYSIHMKYEGGRGSGAENCHLIVRRVHAIAVSRKVLWSIFKSPVRSISVGQNAGPVKYRPAAKKASKRIGK